ATATKGIGLRKIMRAKLARPLRRLFLCDGRRRRHGPGRLPKRVGFPAPHGTAALKRLKRLRLTAFGFREGAAWREYASRRQGRQIGKAPADRSKPVLLFASAQVWQRGEQSLGVGVSRCAQYVVFLPDFD